MKIDIERWNKRDLASGYVASFDAKLDGCITIRRLGLIRPQERSEVLWLQIPNLAVGNRQSVGMPPALRDAIGARAAAMFNSATGPDLRYAPPPKREAVDADVEDSLSMAGIDR